MMSKLNLRIIKALPHPKPIMWSRRHQMWWWLWSWYRSLTVENTTTAGPPTDEQGYASWYELWTWLFFMVLRSVKGFLLIYINKIEVSGTSIKYYCTEYEYLFVRCYLRICFISLLKWLDRFLQDFHWEIADIINIVHIVLLGELRCTIINVIYWEYSFRSKNILESCLYFLSYPFQISQLFKILV